MDTSNRRRLAFAILVSALAAVSALADDSPSKNIALLCNPGSTPRTALGAPATTQVDDLRLEATVKWLGPSTRGSLIVYNGHGAVSGWGIFVLASTDTPANSVAVLAGGVVVAPSPITLTAGKWQRVRMDRVDQVVTLSVRDVERDDDDDDDDTSVQTYSFGVIPVNPVGGGFRHIEQTQVGDAFNGFIENARIKGLDASESVIESWAFNHGTPAGRYELFGTTSTGVNGHVLNLQNTVWAVPVRKKKKNDD